MEFSKVIDPAPWPNGGPRTLMQLAFLVT